MRAAWPRVAEVHAARRRIAGLARRTPLVASPALSRASGADVHLKLETLQATGAFKARGAANAIAALDETARRRGVVAYSTGNHGRAVAAMARRAGAPATVCVSERVTPGKLAALERAGCRLHVAGRSQDAAAAEARRLQAEEGLTPIDPINDPAVIAGHGTIGLELLEDMPELEAVVVPVSGGALVSGIALAVKAADPGIRVVGVCMERGAAMHASLRAGRPVLVEEAESLADSLQGGILLDNRYTFAMVRELVDEVRLVGEDDIARAMAHGLLAEGLVLEGAAATPIALLQRDGAAGLGRRIALVLTGGAVDPGELLRIAARYGATPAEAAAAGTA